MTELPIIAKLSPNVTSITDTRSSYCGADAVSLINTVLGMAIDIDAKGPSSIENPVFGTCRQATASWMVMAGL